MHNLLWALRDMLRWRRSLAVWLLLAVLTTVADSYLAAFFPAVLIDRLTTNSTGHALFSVIVAYCGLWVAVKLTQKYSDATINGSDLLLTFRYGARISQAAMNLPYADWQTTACRDQEQRAKNAVANNSTAAMKLLATLKDFCTGLAGFLVYVVTLSQLHPLVAVLLTAGCALNWGAQRWAIRKTREVREGKLADDRELRYLQRILRDFSGAGDIRIYSLADWLCARFRAAAGRDLKNERRINGYTFRASWIDLLVLLARDGAAYAYLIYLMGRGQITVAEFVLYVGLIATFAGWIQGIAQSGNMLHASALEWMDIRTFIDRKPEQDVRPRVGEAALPKPLRFEKVSFSYGDSSRKVLDSASLTVRPGEKVAIVGLNGAGKTTLLKLMCGLLTPTEGKIFVGEAPLDGETLEDYQASLAAIWQDSALLPVTIAENVSCLPLAETDLQRVEASLERAGLLDFVRNLREGVQTRLMAQLSPNGVNLSGGEKQKLFLARALYGNAAYLVLDEPTAQLDPIAERQMYLNYLDMAPEATIFFVSHRLASTSFCDTIVLVEDGKILEHGTHAELMQLNGRYAQLYQIQSQYYENEEAAHVEVDAVGN